MPGMARGKRDVAGADASPASATTLANCRARALIGSMISSPPATARLPPGRKSYWMSTTTSASSEPGCIAILLGGGGRGVGCRRARCRAPARRIRRRCISRPTPSPVTTAVTSVTQVGLELGHLLLGETGVEVLLRRVVDQLVAGVDEVHGLGQLLGADALGRAREGDDKSRRRTTSPWRRHRPPTEPARHRQRAPGSGRGRE